jgi:hypothetical protein
LWPANHHAAPTSSNSATTATARVAKAELCLATDMKIGARENCELMI